jgi:hypothetical protein
MKPHVATALALVGWYLMIAPMGTTPASLSQWQILGTYDNASDCQQKLEALSQPPKSRSPSSRAIKRAQTPPMGCIATDDPRLKQH